MRYDKALIRLPMMLLAAWAVSGCGPQIQLRPLFPPAAELAVEPKPVPPADIVTSAQAGAVYSARIEGWGERGWLTVARLCRYYKAQGMPGLTCPAP